MWKGHNYFIHYIFILYILYINGYTRGHTNIHIHYTMGCKENIRILLTAIYF